MERRNGQVGMTDFDVILVGGGLANGLIATRLTARRPELKVLIVEAGARLGGNHTWSFHATDVTPAQDRWLQPMVVRAWAEQDVVFPAFRRRIATGYRSIGSDDFHRVVSTLPGISVELGRRVTAVEPDAIEFVGGQRVVARCVIDGRGLQWVSGVAFGYQKFVGLEVETRRPHGLRYPVIMDATVDQIDGYRFVYCLPFDETRMLIEDTYYSDHAALEVDLLARRVRDYAQAAGWEIASVVRDEAGVLPIMLDGGIESFWPSQAMAQARSGMRAGLFHQTTGYSLPLAAEVADALVELAPLTTASASRIIRDIGEACWSRQSFFRMLNRLLFISARPDERRDVMQRFYRLPQPLIERFYAGKPTAFDKAQILTGRPPIPVMRALQGLSPWSARPRRPMTPGRPQ